MRMLSCSFFKRRSKKPKASWDESMIVAAEQIRSRLQEEVDVMQVEVDVENGCGMVEKTNASRTAGLFLAAHRINALKLDWRASMVTVKKSK